MAENTNDQGADKAVAAADPAATDAAAKAAGTDDKVAQAATNAETPKEQTVPLSRLQAVIAQRAETERAKEALARELKLANDTLAEFQALGQRTNGDAAANGNAGQQATRTGANGKALSPQELQRLVAEEAQKQNFTQRCNDSAAAGRAAHQDFDKIVLGDLASISPVIDPQTGRPTLPIPLVEAALETGQAHEVLYALGKDINEASRIMSLRPVAQIAELVKFASKLKAASEETDEGAASDVRVSRAPAPIKSPTKSGPVKPNFTIYDTDNFDTETWIKQREKQIADSRANR